MLLIEYKKARLKYAVVETYQAGLELSGTEVKALRAKSGSLDGSHVVVRGGEAYLVGATIPPYQVANTKKGYDPERSRRLLLGKKELHDLAKMEDKKGLTIVPISVYNKGAKLKVRIAVARGKKARDKREDLKKKSVKRDIERLMKDR